MDINRRSIENTQKICEVSEGHFIDASLKRQIEALSNSIDLFLADFSLS
jgi:hypothetical protein